MTLHDILRKHWGFTQFRPLQEDIVRSVMDGVDTLALLPTGGGKSLCYQVPAIAMKGMCLVVSPLISLIKDQVQQLEKRGVTALSIYSGMSFREIDRTLEQAAQGKTKFLYVSPERLQTELFKARLERMNINLLAVDEAHCISQWGYDFRPPYLQIADIRPLIGEEVPVLALTATATETVRKDIQDKMRFRKDSRVFVQSFERKNLSYSVLKEESKAQRLTSMLEKVKGTGIVFVGTRKYAKELAWELSQNGVSASFYHAGLPVEERNRRQQEWIENKQRVIVCTNAFGMGIDKPDVRMVVHMEPPESPEAYFQEAGRAGRDGKKAFAVCLYEEADIEKLHEKFEQKYPSVAEVKRVYQALANFLEVAEGAGAGASYDFDLSKMCKTFNLQPVVTHNALKLLEQEGYLTLSDSVRIPSRVNVQLNREQLYRYEVAHPQEEIVIKAVLRLYGGAFDGYVPIREQDIARFLNIDTGTVIAKLREIQKQEAIDYVPAKDAPQLTFTVPRMDAKYLKLNETAITKRKEAQRKRLEAMVHYLTSTTECRSKMLLAYFGETKAERCGICDVCLERHRLEITDAEFETHVGTVKDVLKKKPLSLQQLVAQLSHIREDKLIHVTRWMLDTGLVEQAELNVLKWKG
jgi:ATP-dependent DNA helicase RecQ